MVFVHEGGIFSMFICHSPLLVDKALGIIRGNTVTIKLHTAMKLHWYKLSESLITIR